MHRELSLPALLLLAETAAVAVMVAAMFLPWLMYANPGPILSIPPAWTAGATMEWQPSIGGFDGAAVLASLGMYVCVAGLVLRILMRGDWTKLVLELGFGSAVLGSIVAFTESQAMGTTAASTMGPGAGMGVFGVAAVVGVAVTAFDLAGSARPLTRRI